MKRWIGLALAGGVLCVAPLLLRPHKQTAAIEEGGSEDDPLARAKREQGFAKPVTPSALTGIDLTKLKFSEESEVTAPAYGARTAHLTLDPTLQRLAQHLLRTSGIPEAALVMTETATGKVLVWANHVEKGPARDLCLEATAPAASIFKIVTAAALVEHAGLGPETKQCYWGGEQRINAVNLLDDPRRDRWCATLADAMGRSLNTVFAKLASKHLDPSKLVSTAHALGFGEPLSFDVPVAPNALSVPEEPLAFARTSAGFWNTTLSPLGGAVLASTIANHGAMIRPYVVDTVTESGSVLFKATPRQVIRRAIKTETADAVLRMMETTVSEGTCYRAFHDPAGNMFLPNIPIAGKTGTLSHAETEQFYTWFVGVAPSHTPEITVSVLAVNSATWRVKANVLGRDMLRAYFASKDTPGVTMPKGAAVAQR